MQREVKSSRDFWIGVLANILMQILVSIAGGIAVHFIIKYLQALGWM